jgi:hypothetical protein
MVVVTGRYTMDKLKDKARQYLAERADLLGAIRLPQTAFKENAGTEVVTDVLFFRKREPGAAASGPAWLGHGEISGLNKTGETHKALINEYFANHPEMVLGTHSFKGTMRSANEYTVEPNPNPPIEEQFAAAVERLPADVYKPKVEIKTEANRPPLERDFNPKSKKEGGLYVSDKGEVMRVESGSGVPKFIGYVARSGATTTFVDKGAKIEGAMSAYMLDMNADTLVWKQLAPLTRINLAQLSLAKEFLLFLAGALIVFKPRMLGVYQNIDRSA